MLCLGGVASCGFTIFNNWWHLPERLYVDYDSGAYIIEELQPKKELDLIFYNSQQAMYSG